MRGLKGKTAIITGGLGDLGYVSGKRLLEESCRVALLDLREDREGMAQRIGAKFFQVDIANETSVKSAAAQVERELGPAAILVNSAAYFVFKGVEASAEDWQRACAVNIAGASLMTKHVVEQTRQLGGGSVINFSSVSGFVGQPQFATYNATKFAIRGLTKC